MTFNRNPPDKISSDVEDENTLSIDEFFRQLEEREKDLHITQAGTIIEIDESEIEQFIDETDKRTAPEFYQPEYGVSSSPKADKPKTSGIAPSERSSADLKNQIANLQNQIAKLETERGEIRELTRRRQTDFDNFKKRIERDRSETFRNQLSNLAKQILPVLDNLNRALDAASGYGEEAQNFRHFFEGIMLVNQQLNEVLEEMGVQQIAAVGEAFDPHFHEAVAAEKSTEVPPNTITTELLRGYKIDDRVIRPSMVKVSK